MSWRLKLVRRSSETTEETPIKRSNDVESMQVPPVESSAWTSDKQLSLLTLIGLTLVTTFITYIVFRPFLTALFIAIIMAIASAPLHKRVSRKIRNRTLAALTTTALVIFAVLIPITVVGAKLTIEVIGNDRGVLSQLSNTGTWPARLDPFIEEAAEQTGLPPAQLKAEIAQRARDLRTRLIAVAGTLAQRFARRMVMLLLGAVFLFPLIRSNDELRRGALGMLPLSPERTRELAAAVNQGVIANIYGMLSVGVAEGLLIAIGVWIVGLSAPLIWAQSQRLSHSCHTLGYRWYGFREASFWRCTTNYVRLAFSRVKTNSLLITLSLMGGLAVFGPIGFFVGPVSVVVLASLLRILREEHATVRGVRNEVA